MSLDNPVVETADKFYKSAEDSDLVETPEATDVTETDDIQDPLPKEGEELEKPEEGKTEPEESEETDDDEETQYVEIDGKEISLEDIRESLKSDFMQSDYTKKTTALSEERKTFEAERDSERETLLKSQSEVSDMRDQLTVLVAESEEIDWEELKEDDPDRYIELKELADKRKAALEKVKADRETPADDPALIQAEQEKLFAANPDWFDDDNKPTETYSKDTALMNEYATKAGFTADEFKQMTRAHYLTTILKAAKYDQLQEKGRKIKKTREKVPVVTKPKAKKTSTVKKSAADTFYGK